jgi:zinc transport system substrate-binding protein
MTFPKEQSMSRTFSHFDEPACKRCSRLTIALLAAGLSYAGTATADDLKVVATIKPIHSLVAQVMGEGDQPHLLVTGAASPHTYSLKPSDARALNSARLVFRTSEEIEPFTRKIVSSLPKSVTVVTLADAPGLTILDKREGNSFETHDHGHNHGHDHGKKGHHHEASSRDGHVWLDPDNAIAMVRAIEKALSEAVPQRAGEFQANAEKAIERIGMLTKRIEADLAPLKGRDFVVFHDAYQYFERRFGLNAVGALTVSPDLKPSAKRMGEIRQRLKGLGAACVFGEPNHSRALLDAVTEGLTTRGGSLDPEGLAVAEGPNAYVDILRGLSKGLTTCLAATS